jgi:hypothetical protein
VHELLVVCPPEETDTVARLVAPVADDLRIHIVSEDDICPDATRSVDPKTGLTRGWYAQQILKLAAADRVTTPFYLTLDSDIVCFRKLSSADLIDEDGRGLFGTECAQTYVDLYNPVFAAKEARAKERRIGVSTELLGFPYEERYDGRFPSETPVLYHAESMREMCGRLSEQHDRQWSEVLSGTTGWTEMALYMSYVENVGRLEEVHRLGGHNSVLHLDGSVWHVAERYRDARPYDAAHFEALRDGDEGYFVAIQSWLDGDEWLPQAGCASIEEFYDRLGCVLGVATG